MKKRRRLNMLRHIQNLLLLLLFSISAFEVKNCYAQKQEIFNVKSGSVESIFQQIKAQSSYEFFYNTEVLDVKKHVELTISRGSLDDVLQEVLGKIYMYRIQDNYILISKRQEGNMQAVKEVTIKGVVKDCRGLTLPGVSVLLKGTTIGVSTNSKGEFSLTVPMQDTIILRCSFIGMKTEEVMVVKNFKEVLIITLEEEIATLNEVQVISTGYQEIDRSKMTGAVEVVTAKDIANKGYTSIDQVLKGTLAGVAAMNVSGRPGAQAQIRIRGVNSLTGDMEPIWIVDGMPLQGDLPSSVGTGAMDLENTILTSGIGNISPDDVESITILKDAAATAIYGARAANGVIVIKTKRGRIGKSYINIQSSFAISEAPKNRLDMMNTEEKIVFEKTLYEDFPNLELNGRVTRLLRYLDEGRISQEEANTELGRLSKINTNWFDEIFRIALTHSHSITLSGGSEKTQFYSSLNYSKEQGIIPNNTYERFGASLKLTHDFNERLRIYFDLTTTLRNEQSSASAVNPLYYATFANTYEAPYDESGEYVYDRSYMPDLSMVKDGYMYDFNMLKDLKENTTRTKYMSDQVNLKLEFKIMDGLMYSLLGTLANTSSYTRKEIAPGSYTSKVNSWIKDIYQEQEIPDELNLGSLQEDHARAFSWTIRNQLEFVKEFKGKHFVNVVVGQEASSQITNSFMQYSPQYDVDKGLIGWPSLEGIDAGDLDMERLHGTDKGQDRSVSFFATASYAYANRYILAVSARLDGADIIGTDNRFSPLWNVSLKWNIHEEPFMRNVAFVNVLSLRGSYGFTGSIDRNAYPFTLMSFGELHYYEGIQVPTRITPGNPSVRWQKKEDRSVGIDLSMLNNRVNATVNYYCNDVRDLLGQKQIPYSTGRGDIVANLSSLRNSGWEFSLTTVNLSYADFRWTTSFNISKNKNRITEAYYQKISDLTTLRRHYCVEGYPVNAWFGFKSAGINPQTGEYLFYTDAKDENGNSKGVPYNGRYLAVGGYSTENGYYLGESEPPVSGGFATMLNYKRISLSAQFSFMTGHKIESFKSFNGSLANASRLNQLKTEANRWRKPGDITNVPKYSTDRNSISLLEITDDKLESGNYLKCNVVSLGYNLSLELCKKMCLSQARFTFNIHNLFTATRYRGIDPETLGAFGYPSARKYMFTLSLGI